MEQAQGIDAVKGRVIAAIDRLPWLSQAGLSGVGRVNKTLGQVARYLTEPLYDSGDVFGPAVVRSK
ncbi:hypothetical protein [Streptomyces stackebrandtii]|uniref:hypothetical protein n=1 Tax=Streptomyces stackebrandtii TaxID=3051177 RepID=UPI0028DC005C|nr:hypothetical protein [Streptomyces sp. DSM 40976]